MIYNEIEPFAAEWLQQLMRSGYLPQASVVTDSIENLHPADLSHRVQCHFFAGIGVWPWALQEAGWPSEITTWTGSCPCQPFSGAGKKLGIADHRHLWPAWSWLIRQCRPSIILGEQVAGSHGKAWLDIVLTELETLGYTCGATIMGACGVGAPHIRKRIYWMAHSGGVAKGWNSGKARREKDQTQLRGNRDRSADGCRDDGPWSNREWLECSDGKKRPVKPGITPLADGVAGRVGTLRGYGNALVAQQAIEWAKMVLDLI